MGKCVLDNASGARGGSSMWEFPHPIQKWRKSAYTCDNIRLSQVRISLDYLCCFLHKIICVRGCANLVPKSACNRNI